MQYDLACSMNSYFKADSNAERSICFMRAYRNEISALSHLYGYNDEYREKVYGAKLELFQSLNPFHYPKRLKMNS